ncbi:MAG: tRNA (adenosine(37)-N6)-threonylcarbamoyltransferase complex dimerization subunit type 1 TsaB, partial [Planctomycetes bacterium]|nr:tRNA (adenosine(37)-N6)-threonylcarbamoyltransferase complex dimerization subunit type 1 TsaB [Planctomycetota bacterium]
MKVVGFETSGPTGSVGASEEGRTSERVFPEGTQHGRLLAAETEALLRALGWSLEGVGILAVSAGPGSYTGLRIGMAFAKGLAFAAGKPLVAVPTLEAMARTPPPGEGPVAVVLDARWGHAYAAAFESCGGRLRRLTQDLVGGPDEVFAQLPKGARFFGSGAPAFRDRLERIGSVAPPGPWDRPSAAVVAAMGEEAFRERGAGD